jgi:hypothetical protein
MNKTLNERVLKRARESGARAARAWRKNCRALASLIFPESRKGGYK